MNEDHLNCGQYIEINLPDWAIKTKEMVKVCCEERFMLCLEVDRLRESEQIHEETNELFDKWIDEFFTINGLSHLIDSYHNFISNKMDEEGNDD